MFAVIRRWRTDDLDRLVVVSQASDQLFADVGLDLPPDDPTDELLSAEHVLVADVPPVAGFAVINTVDGNAHLASLAVHPEFGRRGLGSQLLEAACSATDLPAITLTTFVDVPWNKRWYEARGFEVLAEEEWGPQLRAVWTAEGEAGIQVAPRTAMIRHLSQAGAGA